MYTYLLIDLVTVITGVPFVSPLVVGMCFPVFGYDFTGVLLVGFIYM